MSDTCIVCLGELATSPTTTLGNTNPSASSSDERSDESGDVVVVNPEEEIIAHLLPCGHNLHDACLKPWVERANSCPICRATFNQVELTNYIDGPVLDSYAVKDKVQVADLDSNLVADLDFSDDHTDPCIVCEQFGDESQLLLCDGCTQSCHVHCAGLDSIPAGSWFCYDCQTDPQVNFRAEGHAHRAPTVVTISGSRRRNHRGRGRGVARNGSVTIGSGSESNRTRNSRREEERDPRAAWARLWRSVASRTAIDLDFPFDDEEDSFELNRTAAQQREFREWQRRLEVASRAGVHNVASRFRQVAPVHRQNTQQQSHRQDQATATSSRVPPTPESQEEIRAWNAFDKAMIIGQDQVGTSNNASSSGLGRGRGRKRKSPERDEERDEEQREAEEPARKRKRARGMRNSEVIDLTGSSPAASASSSRRPTIGPSAHYTQNNPPASASASTFRLPNISTSGTRPQPIAIPSANRGPTFLQSLLDEVEAGSSTNGQDLDGHGSDTTARNNNNSATGLGLQYAYPFSNPTSPPPIDRASSSSPDPSPPGSGRVTPRRALSPNGRVLTLSPGEFSPRAMTPPPRPGSPPSLTSNISPIFPAAPPLPPVPKEREVESEVEMLSPAALSSEEEEFDDVGHIEISERGRQRDAAQKMNKGKEREGESKLAISNGSNQRHQRAMSDTKATNSTTTITNPTTTTTATTTNQPTTTMSSIHQNKSSTASTKDKQHSVLDLETKTRLQSLVKAALRPHYHAGKVNAAEYTSINKKVSRYLYDKYDHSDQAGQMDGLEDKWKSVAGKMVEEMLKNGLEAGVYES